MKNWRRYIVAGAVAITAMAVFGISQFLNARPDAPSRDRLEPINSRIPEELAIGGKEQAFLAGNHYMVNMNSELSDTFTHNGWRGSGRSMAPSMGFPSFTYPTGGFDQPLWASAFGITAYLPDVSKAGAGSDRVEGAFVGTNNVYRFPKLAPVNLPTGYWSDLGGMGSAGFGLGTVGPGGYREPFITDTVFKTNNGVNVHRQSYSFSYGYGHTNDFIILRNVLDVTGEVDILLDGTNVQSDVVIKNFFAIFNYDFDIGVARSPQGGGVSGGGGGDDKQPPGVFRRTMPKATPVDLINSGRFDRPPYGPRFYSGLVTMFDEDAPGIDGVDTYLWNTTLGLFNPMHVGEASLMVLEGDGRGPMGDLDAEAALDIFEAPSIGVFQTHEWWVSDLRGVYNWYIGSMTKYLTDATIANNAVSGDITGNATLFTSSGKMTDTTDISTWTAKTQTGQEAEGYGMLWGDPRNLTQPNNPGLRAGVNLKKGMYDHITLFDLDGVFKGIVPDPYEGSDTKEETSGPGCIRNALGWGPYTKGPGEALTIWHVDLAGAGKDGAYDVYLRAQDVWMQRKYNPVNDTYYWDGSNDRIIPVYDANGAIVRDADGNAMTEVMNFGRGADSGTLFHPPPPPTLSVFPTNNGTIALAWANNAETARDPGTGSIDFAKYRVYRASGFIDQFPTATVAHPVGYNSTMIPPNLGLSDGASPVIDVSDPTSSAVKQGHPYARFIHEGLTLGADFNIGRVYDFVSPKLVNNFAAPNFVGPYVQIAEFGGGSGNQINTLSPPEEVTYPNPLAADRRIPGFEDDTITTKPSSSQIVEINNGLGATTAIGMSSFPDRYGDAIGSGDTQITSVGGIKVDPRLIGKSGYMFEDPSVLIGFSYWYYVAAVDNESAVQYDFDNYVLDQNSTQQQIVRTINGLESFYTMNANGTDGRWHGQWPYRGLTIGPQVPGQDVIPTTIVRNNVESGQADFTDLVTVAPNPFVFQAQWDLATRSQSVKFFNMPVPSRVTVFDAAGLLVDQFSLPTSKTTGGVDEWDLKNKSNVPVSSGLYIIVIEAEIGGVNYTKTLKLYVRR
ncbi:MAG: hypothetical protein OXO51_10990 [Gemmatimonadota bacterium]|nr:hypothetical protein [Gemmatimonadota bacterium]